MEHLSDHVCGGLPVSMGYVMVTYCHHHDAWGVRAWVVRQAGAEPVVTQAEEHWLGPFDGIEFATRLAGSLLGQVLGSLPELR